MKGLEDHQSYGLVVKGPPPLQLKSHYYMPHYKFKLVSKGFANLNGVGEFEESVGGEV